MDTNSHKKNHLLKVHNTLPRVFAVGCLISKLERGGPSFGNFRLFAGGGGAALDDSVVGIKMV